MPINFVGLDSFNSEISFCKIESSAPSAGIANPVETVLYIETTNPSACFSSILRLAHFNANAIAVLKSDGFFFSELLIYNVLIPLL